MRRLSEHVKFGAMLRDGDGERETGAPGQGLGGWEKVTDMHHRPCEWFRVTEYLRIGSCAGACRGGRADRGIKQSDRIMKQAKDKHKA